ncbi:hypothetical protein OsI_22002 [Oryza sativa Indica Group]|uniref:Uncharacterized protein n=5 Tax=Oryza TaxID=4527 RepID=Q69V33_ORYSJ|nr:hypothetical protein OsI_22002 [Oryza sativa Indica Group]EAZ36125.1 hypothetical protein OsJ_20436 [Oryza sativa Japonica Group]KAF2925618.1 hypothetical protein DAI22_06g066400 [Oryza sativa Japonica Group]BAD35645.1 hypothetical protein [Oryza sativa Japonica Group]
MAQSHVDPVIAEEEALDANQSRFLIANWPDETAFSSAELLTDSNEWDLIVSFGAFISVMHHRLPGFRVNAEILKSKHVVFA